MIRSLLEKVFAVREGELFRALSMQLYIFLVITTLLILKPAVNSLFLSTYGIESLPNAYIFVALIAGIITSLYGKIVSRVPFIYLNIGTLSSSIMALVFFGFALQTGFWSDWLLYIFYIWLAIFAVLTTSQFWVLVNIVFNEREFKRLVGLIGAGGIAGGIFGGYLTSFLSGYLNSIQLPFVGAFTIALCIPLTFLIYRKNKKSGGKPITVDVSAKEENPESPLRLILQSRHLTLLAAIVGVSNVVAKLVDFQFSGMAAALISDPEELTAFFGFWFSTFNVGALIIQLFVTRFLLSRLGVGFSLLLLPVSIALSVICLMIAPELLIAVIAMKMADGSFKQSINKSAIELLVLPISVTIKNQTKTFIDVFVDSLAAGFSGLLLIFVIKGLSLTGVAISGLILVFTIVWIVLVSKVRQEYLLTFKQKIITSLGKNTSSNKRIRKAAVINDLMDSLMSGSKTEKISALRQIEHFKNKKYNKIVFTLLKSEDPGVRAEAFQYLSHYKGLKIYHHAEKMTDDPSVKVRMVAIAYLIENTPVKERKIIIKQLDSPNAEIRGMALVSLAKQIQFNPKLKERYQLKNRILKYLQDIPAITDISVRYMKKVFVIQAIGHANIPDLFPYLKVYFKDKKTVVVRQAIQAAGRTHHAYFLKDLIRFSTKMTYSRMAKDALKNYKNNLIPAFKEILKEKPQDLETIRLLPSIAKQINKPKSINFLFKLLEHKDATVRQNALKGLSELHLNFPKLKFRKKRVVLQIVEEVLRFQGTLTLLFVQSNPKIPDTANVVPIRKRVVSLLKKQLNNQLDNIFFLLSLRYSRDNISAIHKAMRSPKVRLRNTALEFLDNLLESRLKSTLIPLLEVAVVNNSKRKNLAKLDLEIPDHYASLEEILKSGKDVRLKIATLHLITKLNQPEHQVLVRAAAESTDLELSLFAKRILEDYVGSATG